MGLSSLPVLGCRAHPPGAPGEAPPCLAHLLGILVLISFWQHHFNLCLCLNLSPPLCLYLSFSGASKDTTIGRRAHPKPALPHSAWTYISRDPVSQDCHILRVCVGITWAWEALSAPLQLVTGSQLYRTQYIQLAVFVLKPLWQKQCSGNRARVSPAFLAPETGSVEDSFSTDGGGVGRQEAELRL